MVSISPFVTAKSIIFFGFLVCGCIKDPCTEMCAQVAEEIETCLQEWPVSWEVLSVDSQQEFTLSCQTTWSVERSILEPRALDDAYEQCSESLEYLTSNVHICDHLRAIYLIEENYE